MTIIDLLRRFRRTDPVPPVRVARPTLGVDCTDIDPCTFGAAPFEFTSEVAMTQFAIARSRVEATPLAWFAQARSQADALRLAFGDDWRIDLLRSTDEESVFLLTERDFGLRIVYPMRRIHYRTWCRHPDKPTGRIPFTMARSRAVLVQDRCEWLIAELYGNYVATEDLRSTARKIEARAARAAADLYSAKDEARVRELDEALVEVWLAENGANAERRAAVRTMVALGAPVSTCMGDPVSVSGSKVGTRA